ncbi:MAG: hypothetical protein ABIJ74_03255 [archaeon]
MGKGFIFSTDAVIGVATVIILALILSFPYSIEEGNEANLLFIKQELQNQAITAYYTGNTASQVGLSPNNSDFNNLDYAQCFVLYDYNYSFRGIYGQGKPSEQKYCMGKRALR